MFIENLARYFHTVKYLKRQQLVYRLLRRFSTDVEVPSFNGKIKLCDTVRLIPGTARSFALAGQHEFNFLNIAKSFEPASMDWKSAEMSKLWRYNLHYFDYILDSNRSKENVKWLISEWIEHNPLGTDDAWEPFPVSLRMVNWIKLFLRLDFKGQIEGPWLKSLYHQALWLEKNIEYHLLANHLFKNGKALVFAGLYFAGDDAERWLKKGLQILSTQLEEQILPDGGHFERSPMYHAMVLEDCLDLLNICTGHRNKNVTDFMAYLKPVTGTMLSLLLGLTHPDGEIALFNDAAFGIEATPAELTEYYERLTGEQVRVPSEKAWSLPATGYYVMSPKSGDRLIIDCGPVGPDYQPGHSHCDNLSFELSLKGRRVIVDSGCCQYVDGDIRRYNRGNAGHNTLTIDGENQSEVWGAHRCGRRAYPLYANLEERADGSLHFSGAHNGYRHLKGSPVHNRTITWSGDTFLIEDRVEGKGSHDIEAQLHIHPGLVVELTGGNAMIRDDRDLLATITLQGEGSIEKTEGWYCPEFGIKRPCVVLTYVKKNVSLPFDGGWIITTGN